MSGVCDGDTVTAGDGVPGDDGAAAGVLLGAAAGSGAQAVSARTRATAIAPSTGRMTGVRDRSEDIPLTVRPGADIRQGDQVATRDGRCFTSPSHSQIRRDVIVPAHRMLASTTI